MALMSIKPITLIHWNAKPIDIGEGQSAGMIPIAPPGDGIVPAGFKQEESLEWSVSLENLPYLLGHYDVCLKSREGRIYGYFNDKGEGFQTSRKKMPALPLLSKRLRGSVV